MTHQTTPAAKTPAILLINPKYPHNVGASVRAASCYGLTQVWYTGKRVELQLRETKRLPREERMRGYRDVQLVHCGDHPLDHFPKAAIPIAVEIHRGAEPLPLFEHPETAVYIFGPEEARYPPQSAAIATALSLFQPVTVLTWQPPSTPHSMIEQPNAIGPASRDYLAWLKIINTPAMWTTKQPIPLQHPDQPLNSRNGSPNSGSN